MSARPKSSPATPRRLPPNRLLPAAYCLLVLLAGCPSSKSVTDGPGGDLPLQGVRLRLLVVGDPDLASAAGQLQGEWSALTGSSFQLESTTQEALNTAGRLDADALICPSCQLGPLAERKLLAPVPEKLRPNRPLEDAGENDWTGVFELLKLREAVWGKTLYAVPFGSPVLTCYYRADLLGKLGRRPPQTWAEYHELAQLLADRSKLGHTAPAEDAPWYGTIEPLSPGWAGLVLLARAAPYAKHRDNYSTLFDIRTMEPLVAGPPFVRALEELVAAARLGPPEQLRYDPTAVRTAFWQGRCGMALTWPTAAKGGTGGTAGLPGSSSGSGIQVGFVELPGSAEVYDVGTKLWDARAASDDPLVPLVGVAGRMGVVSAASRHPQAAFRLLLWLAGTKHSTQVCAASRATTLFRDSHLKSPRKWVERPVSATAASDYAMVTEATLARQDGLFALRIPGRTEYLAALDEAVHRAVRGEQSAAAALRQAATRWQQVTRRLGVEKQKTAYHHTLGLE